MKQRARLTFDITWAIGLNEPSRSSDPMNTSDAKTSPRACTQPVNSAVKDYHEVVKQVPFMPYIVCRDYSFVLTARSLPACTPIQLMHDNLFSLCRVQETVSTSDGNDGNIATSCHNT